MNCIFQTLSINTCIRLSIMQRVRCCDGNSIQMIASENNDGVLKNKRIIRWMRAHFGEERKLQNASTIGNFASDKLIPSKIHSINQLQCVVKAFQPRPDHCENYYYLPFWWVSINCQFNWQLTDWCWIVCTCIVACVIGLIEWQTILSHYSSKFICLSSELINMRRRQRKFTVYYNQNMSYFCSFESFSFSFIRLFWPITDSFRHAHRNSINRAPFSIRQRKIHVMQTLNSFMVWLPTVACIER